MVTKALGTFFLYAVLAATAENAVLARSLGISRLVRLIDDDGVDTMILGACLCLVTLISGIFAYFSNGFLALTEYRTHLRPLLLTACIIVAFGIVLVMCSFQYDKRKFKHAVNVLPLAAFNATVLGSLLITTVQSFTLWQTVGFAIGTGIGYVAAVEVVAQAQPVLNNPQVPAAFKGLPVTLLYIGILAIAIYAFTGHMVLI